MTTPRMIRPRPTRAPLSEAVVLASLITLSATATAQTSPPTPTPTEGESATVLSPFEVVEDQQLGYAATSSLAGSRLNTQLKDVASSISVVTTEFMRDTGATDLQDILVYQLNTEAAGIGGNYYGRSADDGGYRRETLVNPQRATRIRGLNTADLTRDFFTTSIPMDAYNTSRVDIQRGPNSILFGLGSPAGIINNTLKVPNLSKNAYSVEARFGSYGSHRQMVDADFALLPGQLGLRVIGLNDDAQYRQDFTYNHDKRLHGAVRWQPKLAESVFTQIDVNAESGRITANRPVAVTPQDRITNWFGPLNKYLMYDPMTSNGIPQDPTGAQHRELSAYFAGAPGREWWNGSPATIYADPFSNTIGSAGLDAYRQRDGEPWGGLSGVTNANWSEGGVWNKNQASYYASNATMAQLIKEYESSTGRTFSGFGSSLWPTQMILSGPLAFTDRTLQGPNKQEWNNFDSISANVTQTYLNGRFGVNGAYYKENYRSGYARTINADYVSVDVNAFLRDGSANPNVGRPVVYSDSSGNMTSERREAARATGFYKLNLEDYLSRGSLLTKIFGEQTFTGVYSRQRYANFSRGFNLYAWDAATLETPFLNGNTHSSWWGIHYLGDNLQQVANFDAIPDSAIHGINSGRHPGTSNNALIWDTNTKTWHRANPSILDWKDGLDPLYTGASQGFDDTKSKSFVWQGKLFNDALVPLFGWREDAYERWDKPSTLPRNANQVVMPFDERWNYTGTTALQADEQRRTWGVVLHTQRLLDLADIKLPLGMEVSLTYNDANSFRPSDVGTDVYGRKLDAPSGNTKDYGFIVTALDNKVSLRMTWYKTIQKNTSVSDPSGMLHWNKAGIARTMNAMEMETWTSGIKRQQTTPERLVNQWLFGTYDEAIANTPLPADWQSQMATLINQPLRLRRAAVPGQPTYVAQGQINPETNTPYLAPPLDDDELEYRRQWFAARTEAQWSRPIDQDWWQAMQFVRDGGTDWGMWGQNSPAGQRLTNDLVSKGMEVELTANPTPNWRIAFNASRTTAVRDNILSDWAEYIEKNRDFWFDGYNDTPIDQLNYWNINGYADIRHWYGETTYSSEQDTSGGRLMGFVYGPYQNLIAAQGQSVNELRKWHLNLVTNYTFRSGMLKNVNVGGAVRWQDKAAIGYTPKWNEDAGIWVTDVSRPVFAPSETNYDLWIGYERRLTDKVNWSIQLNVRDLFASDDMIPIMANPDGTTAQVRIPAETTWFVTNTFRF